MGLCEVFPYDGMEPYIFISFSHEDEDDVFPAIEALDAMGYRIWYDRGIAPGTEWPEIIAEHLFHSDVVIAFLSNHSMHSHNCRKEFNYALQKDKNVLPILLEDIQLSPGMEMQMSSIQAILGYQLSSLEKLINEIKNTKFLDNCRKEKTKKIVHYFKLYRQFTGEEILIENSGFSIGRKEEECDYCIKENLAISKKHVSFIIDADKCLIEDNNSTNGTFLNKRRLEKTEQAVLNEGDIIQIGGEKFVFHQHVREV